MSKQYKTHLCTFMGREANLNILLPYIDTCLKIEAIDNYWFIDMTRKRTDHEFIKLKCQELNTKYPGRVHLYNSTERAKIIDDPDTISEFSNDWSVFYKFLLNFNDNDIIAKCDDDTYYIDVETLQAAFEYRWQNKKPFLMHANAINNGVTAYHQSSKSIWKGDKEKLYPLGGLTGPLFAHPEVACDHHDKFASDLIKDRNNIDKYKLNENIHFTNRVSINFIFMNGSDRKMLSKITRQDEYDTSCKYPQFLDRPNLIIGDFTMAHHTYGVQEPVMEKLKTHIKYQKLSDKLNSGEIEFNHKKINSNYIPTSTIKYKSEYIARAWVENNSYCLRDPKTKLYVSTQHITTENKNGKFLKTKWHATTDIKDACILNIDINNDNCIWINNSIQLLRLPHVHELPIERRPKVTNKELCGMGYTYFQGLYTRSKISTSVKNNKISIQPASNTGHTLTPSILNDKIPLDDKRRSNIFWDKNIQFEWDLISLKQHANNVISMKINRPKDMMEYTNDETYATSVIENLPSNNAPRDYIWMVKDYVWEFIQVKNDLYQIKLIADDKHDLYLGKGPGKNNFNVMTLNKPQLWSINKNNLIHQKTGLKLSIEAGSCVLSKIGSVITLDIK